ncbi:MAG: nucleotidyltransferase domain-containing protein [Candidatus Hydrogenedentes bacterium]|nr:nucleotidyltransferase domain-containing protein [Candidatus Hydrogenedentota bacterium]
MADCGLAPNELALLSEVFANVQGLKEVVLYGSRAKGTQRPESDVDLALIGVDDDLEAERVADALEELPLPYRFDVKAYARIGYAPLRDHIERVGVRIYWRGESALQIS